MFVILRRNRSAIFRSTCKAVFTGCAFYMSYLIRIIFLFFSLNSIKISEPRKQKFQKKMFKFPKRQLFFSLSDFKETRSSSNVSLSDFRVLLISIIWLRFHLQTGFLKNGVTFLLMKRLPLKSFFFP